MLGEGHLLGDLMSRNSGIAYSKQDRSRGLLHSALAFGNHSFGVIGGRWSLPGYS